MKEQQQKKQKTTTSEFPKTDAAPWFVRRPGLARTALVAPGSAAGGQARDRRQTRPVSTTRSEVGWPTAGDRAIGGPGEVT